MLTQYCAAVLNEIIFEILVCKEYYGEFTVKIPDMFIFLEVYSGENYIGNEIGFIIKLDELPSSLI